MYHIDYKISIGFGGGQRSFVLNSFHSVTDIILSNVSGCGTFVIFFCVCIFLFLILFLLYFCCSLAVYLYLLGYCFHSCVAIYNFLANYRFHGSVSSMLLSYMFLSIQLAAHPKFHLFLIYCFNTSVLVLMVSVHLLPSVPHSVLMVACVVGCSCFR